jgi:hypothetical protein
LEELVEEDEEEGGDDELDVEEADTGAEVFGLAVVETGEEVDAGLAEGDECKDWWVGWVSTRRQYDTLRYKKAGGERLTLLSPTGQNPITLQTEIHVDEVGAGLAFMLA